MTLTDILVIVAIIIEVWILARQRTIKELKTMLEVFDPKKFKDMQEVYDDFNEKKIRLEVGKRTEYFKDLADRKLDEHVDSIFNELWEFLVSFLNQIPNSKRKRFIKKHFPKNKALVENVYANYGTPPKDAPQQHRSE